MLTNQILVVSLPYQISGLCFNLCLRQETLFAGAQTGCQGCGSKARDPFCSPVTLLSHYSLLGSAQLHEIYCSVLPRSCNTACYNILSIAMDPAVSVSPCNDISKESLVKSEL